MALKVALLLLEAFDLFEVGLLVFIKSIFLVLNFLQLSAGALPLRACLQKIDCASVSHY